MFKKLIAQFTLMPARKPKIPSRTQATLATFRPGQPAVPKWSVLQAAALQVMETDPRRQLLGSDRSVLSGSRVPSGSGPTHRPFVQESTGTVVEVLKKTGLMPPNTFVLAIRPPKGRGVIHKMVRFEGDRAALERQAERYNANKRLFHLKAPVPEPLSFNPVIEPPSKHPSQLMIERRFMGPSVQDMLTPGRLSSEHREALTKRVELAKKKLLTIAKKENLDLEWFKHNPVFDRLDKAYYDFEKDRVVFDFYFESLLNARKKKRADRSLDDDYSR